MAAMPSEADRDLVLFHLSHGVATLTFNRPERMNAWTWRLEERYFDLLERVDDDPDVRVVVVTGSGRGFCPGMDLESLKESSQRPAGTPVAQRRPTNYALQIRKPLLAAINGPCAGIGLVQALVCDVRFAAADAKLATAFTARGLPAEAGISWLLPRLVGYGNALDLLLSSRPVTALEASEMGLVNRVYPADELLPAALDYADQLAANCSPVAMAAVKAQVAADWYRSPDASLAEAVEMVADPKRRPDFAEGVAAYVEKRPPRFRPLPPRGCSL